MRLALAVGAAGAAGALLRHAIDSGLRRGRLPWGLLGVNVAGSLALGLLAGPAVDRRLWAVAGTGLCGGLTTWSAVAWAAVEAGRADRRAATWLVVALVGASLAAAALGLWVSGGR